MCCKLLAKIWTSNFGGKGLSILLIPMLTFSCWKLPRLQLRTLHTPNLLPLPSYPACPSPPETRPHPSLTPPITFCRLLPKGPLQGQPMPPPPPSFEKTTLSSYSCPQSCPQLAATSLRHGCCACLGVLTAHFNNPWRVAAPVDLYTGCDTTRYHQSETQTHPTPHRRCGVERARSLY